MNLQYKDELGSYFSVSTAPRWLEKNGHKPLSSYCIILNFGSNIEMEADLAIVTLKNNSMSFLNPGSYVSSIKSNDEAHYFIEFNSAFYCLELHDKEISCNGLLFGALPYLPILYCSVDEASENQELLNIMLKEFEHNDNTQGDMLRLLLKRLIIIGVRIGRKQLFSNTDPLLEDTDIIRVFQALVEKHFKEKHKVADYADMMFKSPKTLSNTFKKLGSASPLHIIQERIVLEAKRQIYYTDKPIKEIAYDLGFSEPPQFSRLFKIITGKSPSEFSFV
jgi:AraC-like DNA-binding protein